MVAYKGGVGDEVGRYLRTEGATHLPTDSYAAPIRPRVSRARHRHTGAHYSQPRMTRSTPLAFYQLKSGPSPPRPSRRRPAVHPQSPISLLLAARISSHTRTRLPPPLRQLSRPAPRTSPHTFPRLFRPLRLCAQCPAARLPTTMRHVHPPPPPHTCTRPHIRVTCAATAASRLHSWSSDTSAPSPSPAVPGAGPGPSGAASRSASRTPRSTHCPARRAAAATAADPAVEAAAVLLAHSLCRTRRKAVVVVFVCECVWRRGGGLGGRQQD